MGVAIQTVAIGVLLLVGLAACGGQPQALAPAEPVVYQLSSPEAVRSDLVSYSDDSYPFVIQLPREWYAGELSGSTYGIIATSTNQPGQPRAAILVVAEPIENGATIEATVTTAEETLQAQQGITDFRVELDRQATVNQNQARERRYRFLNAGQSIRQRTVYIQGTDNLYAVSLTAPQDVFAQHEATFNDVLVTFEGF